MRRAHCTRTKKFQFPSNGKAYPKFQQYDHIIGGGLVSIPFKRESVSKEAIGIKVLGTDSVSIPFKRESVSKVDIFDKFVSAIEKFQFPSNGKAYPKDECSNQRTETGDDAFQFPSNGKAYPKNLKDLRTFVSYLVSIPFKRESVSKVAAVFMLVLGFSFNSLQTGKRIQRVFWSL